MIFLEIMSFFGIKIIYCPMRKGFWRDREEIFFVGIGGVSMSGLALCLKNMGFRVRGSDVQESARTAALRRAGIEVAIGHRRENLKNAQAVVKNSAIREDNEELAEAAARGIPVVERAELLALVAAQFEKTVAVAGSHGKTTATAMCAHVLDGCCGSVTAHIGGEDEKFGNFYMGGEKFFVTEACEYKENFLRLSPDTALVLNTDPDHLDYYKSAGALAEAYRKFCGRARSVILCGDDKIAGQIPAALTFGFSPRCDVSAEEVRQSGGKYSFILRAGGSVFDRIRLNVYGRHNVYNALAAASVGLLYGFPPYLIAEGVQKFTGIRRRFEEIGRLNGARVIADYAHHPREIAAALQAAHEICRGKVSVVFQPHTYSRTKSLFGDFVNVLSGAEELVIYKTYAAREYFDEEGCALTLAQHLPNALYMESVRELALYLRASLTGGGLALILGAGDIYYAARRALDLLHGAKSR